jgi:hypothetical protein
MAAYAAFKINEAEQVLDDFPPIESRNGSAREFILLSCGTCVFEAMEACHLGRLLIGKDITPNPEILAQLLKKQNVDRARKPPPNHMKPTRDRHNVIIDWYLQNHAR